MPGIIASRSVKVSPACAAAFNKFSPGPSSRKSVGDSHSPIGVVAGGGNRAVGGPPGGRKKRAEPAEPHEQEGGGRPAPAKPERMTLRGLRPRPFPQLGEGRRAAPALILLLHLPEQRPDQF